MRTGDFKQQVREDAVRMDQNNDRPKAALSAWINNANPVSGYRGPSIGVTVNKDLVLKEGDRFYLNFSKHVNRWELKQTLKDTDKKGPDLYAYIDGPDEQEEERAQPNLTDDIPF